MHWEPPGRVFLHPAVMTLPTLGRRRPWGRVRFCCKWEVRLSPRHGFGTRGTRSAAGEAWGGVRDGAAVCQRRPSPAGENEALSFQEFHEPNSYLSACVLYV